MKNLFCYKELPVWDVNSLPQRFCEKHNTKEGTWAKLHIVQGSLDFDILTETNEIVEQFHFDVENQPPFIEPQQWHRIGKVSSDLKCQLSFFCSAEDYVEKKYEMTRTHSEVLAASQIVPIGKVLDLGSGSGRNSLYLQLLGFDVDAVDKSEQSIDNLKEIIEFDQLSKISANIYDINQASLKGEYDFIVSTVVMMFLQPERIPHIIHNMQSITKSGGYNLIVSAMSTEKHPSSIDFSFYFKEGELRDYYKDWEIIKYNEDFGKLHKTDIEGNRIELQFTTLLAKKK